MKIVFTSMLVLLMTVIQAMPTDKDSVENGKKARVSTTVTTPSTSTLVSMQQLQEENAILKVRIAEMENRLENENGMLQYKLTMMTVVNILNDSSKQQKMEDILGHIGFTNMMTSTLLLIKNGGTR